jgi:spermidine/putrescine transport system permease protein
VKPVGRFGTVTLNLYFWLFVAFLFAPLVVLVIFSMNNSMTPTLPLSGFTTKWFAQAFSNGELTGAVVRSAEIALTTAFFATGLGIMASIGLMALRGRALTFAIAALLVPLVVPYISLAVGLLILLQTFGAGPSLTAVVLGHSVITLPFAILVLLPRLRSLDPAMNEAALDLGASSFAAFRLVTLPLIVPALVSSGIICFVTSFDEFAIASFLAPSGQPTYPIFLYASARTPALLPDVIAIGAIVIAASLLLVVTAEAGRSWAERRLVGTSTEVESPPLHASASTVAPG